MHFGGGAKDPQRFRNRRAEMFWGLREVLERGKASLPDDDDVRADLSALRYVFTQDGRIQIESKDDCRKRLGRSPDRADALALAWASAFGRSGQVTNIRFPRLLRAGGWQLSDGY